MITADQFSLRLRQVKGQPVRFGEHRDGENNERNEKRDPEDDLQDIERMDDLLEIDTKRKKADALDPDRRNEPPVDRLIPNDL